MTGSRGAWPDIPVPPATRTDLYELSIAAGYW
jgi:hypothetical protein